MREITKNAARSPCGGRVIKYVSEKKLRLREGTHKAFLGLPAENHHVEAEITRRGGEGAVREFRPLDWHRHVPDGMPTFPKGVKDHEMHLKGGTIE